jgi:hypothetical protein
VLLADRAKQTVVLQGRSSAAELLREVALGGE